ncbi:MAG: alpha/beta hydrolase [Actinomycetota bacterium]
MRVPSSDGVRVAVHDFGGSGTPLLLSHATGFHAYCYLPVADGLGDRFAVYGLDYRGHGDTARPDDWAVDWDRYGDDAVAAARAIAPDGGLIGVGHSMGGAALLMAADREPDLFDMIVAFEPIVFPPPTPESSQPPSVLVDGARRRRSSFDSFDAAIANYSGKPPMAAFTPDVVRMYVAHGFRPSPEGVRLKCDPEHEARTFETGGTHQTWARLPHIDVPVVVVSGARDGSGPPDVAPGIAEQLPNATFLDHPEWNHFGPFTHPQAFADLVLAHTAELH